MDKHIQLKNAAWDLFKPIRNKIRSYEPISLIYNISKELHIIFREGLLTRKLQPWYFHFLIKIAFIYGGEHYPPKIASKNDINKLYNQVHDLANINIFTQEGTFQSFLEFFHATSFQQFWYQNKASRWDIGHQIYLFTNMDWVNYPVNERFLKYTGLNINEFFLLSLAAWAYFFDNKSQTYLTTDYYKTLSPIGTSQKPHLYFDLLSKDFRTLKSYLTTEYNKIESIDYQIFEQSPLIRYPYLRNGSQYQCYCPKILSYSIRHFLYDYFKEIEASPDSNVFSEKFGTMLSNYIEKDIKYLKYNYLTEGIIRKELRKRNINSSLIPDFIIEFERSILIVEVKATEMNFRARVNPASQILNTYLRNNVIKAVKQIYQTAYHIKNKHIEFESPKKVYGFVVTYKQHFIGPCEYAWGNFLEQPLSVFFKDKPYDGSILPYSNIFFLELEEFETFIESSLKNNPDEILENAVENNSDVQTRKHIFVMHLEEYEPFQGLPHIAKASDDLFQSLKEQLMI